jgi:uncharacterized protein (DUF58 family)
MIAPENRLVIWSGLVMIPCGLGFPWFPYPCAGVLAVFLLVVVVDAARASAPLRRIEVRLPEVCRMAKRRPGAVPLTVSNLGDALVDLTLRLTFPPEVRNDQDSRRVQIPASSEVSLAWPCDGMRRGRYRLISCLAQRRSRLGLWTARALLPCECELRVYPDLGRERQKVASLFLRGGSGMHRLRQVGQGREFEKLREYLPGDSYSDIHWKATAKRGRPVTKLFQVEKTQEVYVLIDASRLAARPVESGSSGLEVGLPESPPPERPREGALEYFISATLILALAAQENGDRFGLLVYSDQVKRFIRSGAGKPHFDACRQAVYDLQPEVVSPDLKELAAFIGSNLRRRALLVFLTDFDDPLTTEEFLRNMDVVARRHLVLVNILKPAGLGRLFEREARSIDEIYRALAGQMERQKIRELQRTLYRMGIQMEQLEADWLSARLISQYLSVKQRQAL